MIPSSQSHVRRQNSGSEQDFICLKQCNGVFIFLIPIIAASVQGTTKSPLETHAANLYTFLLAIFIHSFAFAAETKCKTHRTSNSPQQANYSQLFGVVAFISGSLSSVSLVSILVPRLFGYILFMSWAFASTFVTYQHATIIKETYGWILQNIKDASRSLYQNIKDKVSSLWSNQPLLPF